MNNNLEHIRRKIACEQERMPQKNCCCGFRPTGPTGIIGPTGPTERLFKSSNKIILDSNLVFLAAAKISYNFNKKITIS